MAEFAFGDERTCSAQLQSEKAEGTGLVLPAFRNHQRKQQFASKSFSGLKLARSGCSRLLPVVPSYGGYQPGQKRDNFFCKHLPPPSKPSPRPGEKQPCLPARSQYTRRRPRRKDDGETNDNDDQPATADGPLPRPTRRTRRARTDRGLSPDEELAKLATAYLKLQRKHWPKLVEKGLLPEPTTEVIRQMVDDFKSRHRTGTVDVDSVQTYAKAVSRLAGSYNRYSCDNSSASSILDQLVNSLDKAHSEDRFVPWQYVFADYSVTGLDRSRQGYSSYKSLLDDENHLIETTYIDDFTRASRDEIEWWKLAALSKRLNKRLIGASDSFDLNNANSDLLITMFGLVSRMFIKGTREKVKRGMKGAARRGTCLGKLSLGFTRRVHRDEHGNVVYRPDGRPRKEPCIDPETKLFRALMYELFVEKGWSAYKITRYFNELKVDGWDGWTEKGIKDLLWNANAIGVFIWNRTRREYDLETGKMVVVDNPRSEWVIYHNPELAIIPKESWKAARRKLAAMRRSSPLTGRKPSRNQVSATTLFSGTLFCESCSDNNIGGSELKLVRSTDKSKQMGCLNGINSGRGCKLFSSKSTKIIEECLLGYIRDTILTEAALEDLIVKANAYLDEEAKKPLIDIAPMKAEARKVESKIKRLVKRIEDEPDEELCAPFDKRIKELQRELRLLNERIRDGEAQNRKKHIKPLDREQAKKYLAEMRDLLNQEIPMAAEAIRTLTGPIKIRQELVPGRKVGARWIATFHPSLLQLLRRVAGDRDIPNSIILDNSDVAVNKAVELALETVPKYEKLATKFKELRDGGASVDNIASAHGTSWQFASDVLRFADTGERPKWKKGKATGRGAQSAKYKEIHEEVAYLRDKKKMSFLRIKDKLKVGLSTARRAYDYAHRKDIRKAVEHGESPDRGGFSHLGEDVYAEIRKLLNEGVKPKDVADTVGCGTSTVYRIRRNMQKEPGDEQTP